MRSQAWLLPDRFEGRRNFPDGREQVLAGRSGALGATATQHRLTAGTVRDMERFAPVRY